MPINSTHPEYDTYSPLWEMCEDFYDGAMAVKAKGDKYLPRLEEQSEASYQSYKTRTAFFGALGRTVNGMAGSVMRELPAIKLPSQIEYALEDATGKGQTLNETILALLIGLLKKNRMGLMVDIPTPGATPVMILYEGGNIINWADDGSFVVLQERLFEQDPDDKFARIEVIQYRELLLESGFYTVNIWREDPSTKRQGMKSTWRIKQSYTPERRGQRLNYIPFVFVSDMGTDTRVSKPPLYDLVEENLSHYMKSADYCHGLHFTGLPTFFVTGIASDSKTKIRVGAEIALILPNPNARAGFAEFNGQGLNGLKEALIEHEGKMAALGARLIEQNRRGQVQTAESARIQQSGEVAVMSSVINSAEEAVMQALRMMAEWLFADKGEVMLKINRDLVENRIDANTLIALLQAVQAGRISHKTYWEILKNGGYIAPGKLFTGEVSEIKEQFNAIPLDPATVDTPVQQVAASAPNIPGVK